MKLRYGNLNKKNKTSKAKRGNAVIRAAALGVALAVAPGLISCKGKDVDKDKMEQVDKDKNKDKDEKDKNDKGKDDKAEEDKELTPEELNAGLIKAIENGDKDKVSELLEKGADKDTTMHNVSAVWLALNYEKPEIAEMLIVNGAKVEGKNHKGKTMLEHSVYMRYTDLVETLVEGEYYKPSNEELDNSLFEAVLKGKKEITELLLTGGANVNARDAKGETILWRALYAKKTDMVDLLIDEGADIIIENYDGDVFLVYAAKNGYESVVKKVIESVQVEPSDADDALFAAVSKGHEGTAKILIKYGADKNAKDIYGETIIWKALNAKKMSIVEMLIEEGADLNAKDRYGNTLLWKAYKYDMGTFELLVKDGADVNEKSVNGKVLLIEAIDDRYVGTVELLVKYRADPKLKDAKGRDAIEMAKKKKNPEVMKIFEAPKPEEEKITDEQTE